MARKENKYTEMLWSFMSSVNVECWMNHNTDLMENNVAHIDLARRQKLDLCNFFFHLAQCVGLPLTCFQVYAKYCCIKNTSRWNSEKLQTQNFFFAGDRKNCFDFICNNINYLIRLRETRQTRLNLHSNNRYNTDVTTDSLYNWK